MKKVVGICLAMAMALGLVACGGAAGGTGPLVPDVKQPPKSDIIGTFDFSDYWDFDLDGDLDGAGGGSFSGIGGTGLMIEDVYVYSNGAHVLGGYGVEFDYEFPSDGAANGIDGYSVGTVRGVGMGSTGAQIAAAYEGVSCYAFRDDNEIEAFFSDGMGSYQYGSTADFLGQYPGLEEYIVLYMWFTYNGEGMTLDQMINSMSLNGGNDDFYGRHMLMFYMDYDVVEEMYFYSESLN